MKKMIACFCGILILAACHKRGMYEDAQGSLHDDKGCIPPAIHGTWYAGVSPNPDTNYVDIGVNVTRPGYYRIVSDINNGVVFGDSGYFYNTGLNTIRLHARGTFTDALTTAVTLTFDSSICGFLIDVKSTSPTYNAWKFTSNGHVYSGTSTAVLYGIPQSAGSVLNFTGKMPGSDTTLYFDIGMPDLYVYPGTYPATTSGNDFGFNTNLYTVFHSDVTTPDKVVNIVITSATPAADGFEIIVMGTFSGTAANASGGAVPITDGVFHVVVP